MLSVLTRPFRVRAAIVLAALYALCGLAPSAAFAFSDNPGAAHCLMEDHVGVHDHNATHDHHGQAHVHADGSAHQHHDGGAAPQRAGDDDKAVATCCGLFFLAAIPGQPGLSLGFYSPASVVLPVPGQALSGRNPERINRPPIA